MRSRRRTYFLCQGICNYLQLFGGIRAALRAIAAYFKPADHDVKLAVALDLAFQSVEEIAFEFEDFAAAQARHVDVIALRTPLVEMLLALHVHEIEFVNKNMALEQLERTVHGHAIDPSIQLAGVPQDLRGIQVLLGSFNHAQDSTPLVRQPHTARGERGLQTSGSFGFGKGHNL